MVDSFFLSDIACTCGRRVKEEILFDEFRQLGYSEAEALNAMQIKKSCCRKIFMSRPCFDMIDVDPTEVRVPPRKRTGDLKVGRNTGMASSKLEYGTPAATIPSKKGRQYDTSGTGIGSSQEPLTHINLRPGELPVINYPPGISTQPLTPSTPSSFNIFGMPAPVPSITSFGMPAPVPITPQSPSTVAPFSSVVPFTVSHTATPPITIESEIEGNVVDIPEDTTDNPLYFPRVGVGAGLTVPVRPYVTYLAR